MGLVLVAAAIFAGLFIGFMTTFEDLNHLTTRSTNIGDLREGCQPGQVLGFNDEAGLICLDRVTVLDDLKDVEAEDPGQDECLCFNETQWDPQGPFVKEGDIPQFVNGTLPCENLPINGGGAALCNALRWGTPTGAWNATANDPFLSSGGCPFGDFYVVTSAGATDLDGSFPWDVGDALACSATGWKRIGKDVPVTSVNGMIGNVSLGLDDMTDVNLAGQANGDFLGRVGGVWTPQQILLGLNDLTDVFSQFAVASDALVFDGAQWLLNPFCCSGTGDVAQRQGALVRLQADQVITNNIFWTKAQMSDVVSDPGDNYNAGLSRYVVAFDGYYGIWVNTLFAEPVNALTRWRTRTRIRLGGAASIAITEHFIGTTNGVANAPVEEDTLLVLAGFFQFTAGDFVELEVGQESDIASPAGDVLITRANGATIWSIVFHGPV